MTAQPCPYAVLGLPKTATLDDVKRAFRQKALVLHPDKNDRPTANQEFAQLHHAYLSIVDPGSAPVPKRSRHEEAFQNFFKETKRPRPESKLRVDVPITLTNLYTGVVRGVHNVDGTKIDINIAPGSKSGTKVVTDKTTFTLKRTDLESAVYKMKNSDLHYIKIISVFDLLSSPTFTIPSLVPGTPDWTVDCSHDNFVQLSKEGKWMHGFGLPSVSGQGRGNIHIRFDIQYPCQPIPFTGRASLRDIAKQAVYR
jgi:DnaJ-class molecular chaperone